MALKTEDLLAQGLTQEQVNYVMAEFGKEINPIKAERDNLRTQLNTAQTTLKSFEGVNVTELQGKITQLTNDLANKEAEYQSSIAEREFNDLLKEVISASGARNATAVAALLDQNALKQSKNQREDIQKALDGIKKDNDYLFQSEKPVPRVVSTTQGPSQQVDDKKTQANEALRSLFGKE